MTNLGRNTRIQHDVDIDEDQSFYTPMKFVIDYLKQLPSDSQIEIYDGSDDWKPTAVYYRNETDEEYADRLHSVFFRCEQNLKNIFDVEKNRMKNEMLKRKQKLLNELQEIEDALKD